MQQKSILSFMCLLVSFECFQRVTSRSYNNGFIFYDLQTFQSYLPPMVSVSRGRGLASIKYSENGSIWSTFGKPCQCQRSVCGCCAGIKVKQYNFDQKMCANVTFVPPKEEALLKVYLNDKLSSKYGISVRNPSPICIPVMMGIPMEMCVKLSDIAIKGNNLNMCMDFIVRLATTDLFEMHFQCMQMGLDGFQYIDKDGNPVIPPSNSKTKNDDEYYDDDVADDNEIGYISNKKNNKNTTQHTENTIGGTYNVRLQQQMQQLQKAHQVNNEKNDLVTQIKDAQTEIIEAIKTAYGSTAATDTVTELDAEAINTTESETYDDTDVEVETVTEAKTKITTLPTATINPVNNEHKYDAQPNNNIDLPTTADSSITSTKEAAINKPKNAYEHTTTTKNIIGMPKGDIALENVTTNYTSDILKITDSNIGIETTTLADENLTSAYLSAPIMSTTVGATESTTLNSTAYKNALKEALTLQNNSSVTSTSGTARPTLNANASDKISIQTYKRLRGHRIHSISTVGRDIE